MVFSSDCNLLFADDRFAMVTGYVVELHSVPENDKLIKNLTEMCEQTKLSLAQYQI